MVFGHVLGIGSFGKVFYAMKVEKGKPKSQWKEYAVKQIPLEHSEVALREAAMMDMVNHPNCTRLIAQYTSLDYTNLVMEYAAKGDLHMLLADLGSLTVESSRFIASEVAAALNAFHQVELVYGDLKPENVLIHANGHAKLGDFGATRHISQMRKGAQVEGTLIYLAPELANGQAADYSVDWWAFGCLLYQMIAGRPPFWVEEQRKLIEKIVHFKVEVFPGGFPSEASNLIHSLLEVDPAERIGRNGYKEIEAHPFFSDFEVDFEETHTLQAPQFATGTVRASAGPWTQRTFSMMLTPLPEKYYFEAQDYGALPITEKFDEIHSSWIPSKHGVGIFELEVTNPTGSALPRVREIPIPKKGSTPADMEKYAASYILNRGGASNFASAAGAPQPLRKPGLSKPKFDPNAKFPSVSIHAKPTADKSSQEEQLEEERKKRYVINGLDLSAG